MLKLLDEKQGLFKLNAESEGESAYWTGLALKTMARLFRHADESERTQIDGVAPRLGATMKRGDQVQGTGLVFKHVVSTLLWYQSRRYIFIKYRGFLLLFKFS